MKKLKSINNQKGFTLIELMCVMVISSVITASALPKMVSLADEAKEVVRLSNMNKFKSMYESTIAKKTFYTPNNPYTSLENLLNKTETIDVTEYVGIADHPYDNNNGYLPAANDFSGVCIGIGKKVGTYTDKFGLTSTTKIVDTVKYVDNYITPDAINCPSGLPNIQ